MEKEVGNIILSFTKTVKALQIYNIEHPTFRHFFTFFYQKLEQFLKNNNELSFQIEHFTILYADRVIYEENEEDISIAFRLFRDGIRSIDFIEGLTSDELLHFLEIFTKPPQEQDIALGLWEEAFFHIHFNVVEAEEEALPYEITENTAGNVDYDKKITEMIDRENINRNIVLTQSLNSHELQHIKNEISDDEKNSTLPLAITTLLDFLSSESSQEVLDSLIELLKQCIDNGDFYNALRILQKVNKHPESNVIEQLENEPTILSFSKLMNIPSDVIFDEFMSFFGLFSKKSIPHFFKMLSLIERQDRLEALRHKIAQKMQDDLAPMAEFLKSEDVASVTNAIAILGSTTSNKAISYLRPLIQHENPGVRAELVSALENIGEPSIITKFLDDPASDIRLRTLDALTHISSPKIYSMLLRRVRRQDFLALEFPEQRKYFQCLVTHGDNNIISDLKKILIKKSSLFGSKEHRTVKKLAAIGLAQIGTDEALEIIRQGTKDKSKEIKVACEMALRWK